MKDKLNQIKDHITTVIYEYTELTNSIYDTRTKVSREQLEHFIETIEGLFDIEALKILKNSPEDYKYFAAMVKYYPELEFFNVFGVDYAYALYTQTEKSLNKEELFNYKYREEITKDFEVLDELEQIKKIKEKEELRQSYFSLNQRKYVKILNNYQKFVQDLGYAHPYEAYLDVYKIDGEELERQVDEFLENTKEEYSRLFEYFTSKYLPKEIPRRDVYKQEEFRYLYSCQKIEANNVDNYDEDIIYNLLNKFRDAGYYTEEELDKVLIHYATDMTPHNYPAMCLPTFNKHRLEDIRMWLPELKGIESLKYWLHYTGYLIHLLAIDYYENLNYEIEVDVIDKIEWEHSNFEFIAKVFESFLRSSIFWEENVFASQNEIISKNVIEKLLDFSRFIELAFKIYDMILFKITQNFLKFENRIKSSDIRNLKKASKIYYIDYLRIDRPTEDIWTNNYYYKLDITRASLINFKFMNNIKYDFKKLISGEIKEKLYNLFFEGNSKMFTVLAKELLR